MHSIRYNIHNIIGVEIELDVDKQIIDQIDFQIGFFCCTEDTIADVEYRIHILPYKDFHRNEEIPFHMYYLKSGIPGVVVVDPVRSLAIIKRPKGYEIYSDVPFLINIFIQTIFVEKGITLVHAAAVSDSEGRVILFPGAGGVGKTSLLSYFVQECNYQLLGDDIIGISTDGKCYSFPRSFVIKEYHKEVYPQFFSGIDDTSASSLPRRLTSIFHSVGKSAIKFVQSNAPFKGVARDIFKRSKLDKMIKNLFLWAKDSPYFATIPIDEIFGKGVVRQIGDLEVVVNIERYKGSDFSVEDMSEDALVRRIFAIIHHEWIGSMDILFSMGALEIIDLPLYFRQVTKILTKGIHATRINNLCIPERISPIELQDFIRKNPSMFLFSKKK